MTKLILIGPGRGKCFHAQVLIDQPEQARAASADFLQILQKLLRHLAGCLFQQDLAKTDDVIDRRAQVMPDFRQRPPAFPSWGSSRCSLDPGRGHFSDWNDSNSTPT